MQVLSQYSSFAFIISTYLFKANRRHLFSCEVNESGGILIYYVFNVRWTAFVYIFISQQTIYIDICQSIYLFIFTYLSENYLFVYRYLSSLSNFHKSRYTCDYYVAGTGEQDNNHDCRKQHKLEWI